MNTIPLNRHLDSILKKAYHNETITEDDMIFILELRQPDHLNALFKSARELRQVYFNNKVFLHGFLYISTYCRNNCTFCFYSGSNTESPRYRKKTDQVTSAAVALAESGVHMIDLTMGEDPDIFCSDGLGFKSLARLINTVKRETGLPVMISPGVITPHTLQTFSDAGASWYACYQETHRPGLFKQLRPGQSYIDRLDAKRQAHEYGMLIEEGILVGIGETPGDIVCSINNMRSIGADQIRVMNFVPQKGTPMGNIPPPDPLKELLIIALMRLVFPDRLIPATLDVEGLDGLKWRLDAGANVITSIVPPHQGLAGVAQSSLDIDDSRRTTRFIHPILESCNLQAADTEEFQTWINKRLESIKDPADHG